MHPAPSLSLSLSLSPPPAFLRIPGTLHIAGHSPDGDTLHFIPNSSRSSRSSRALRHLAHSNLHRDPFAPLDRPDSLRLRLLGLDAPNLHYRNTSQPLAFAARDALLRAVGFTQFAFDASSLRCTHASPGAVEAIAFTAAADAHGRPLAYLFRPADAEGLDALDALDGPDASALARSINHHLLARGAAYFFATTSMPAEHRAILRAAALDARAHRLGVWTADATARGFSLRTLRSIDARGALVFPKLFRRCVDYLSDCAHGFRGLLTDWLRARGAESVADDDVTVADAAAPVPFASLVAQRGRRISLQADTLDVAFVER